MKKSISLLLLFVVTTSLAVKDQESMMRVIRENQVKYIQFLFTDMLGNLKSVVRPVQYLQEDLKNGIFVDGSSLKGCKRIWESDLKLVPQAPTARLLPWTNNGPANTATLICDIYAQDEEPYTSDPRFILQKTLNEAEQLGYRFITGPELEFYVFKNGPNQKPLLPEKPNNSNYIATSDNCTAVNVVGNILTMLEMFELQPQKYHQEVSDSQHEIVLQHDNALEIADKIVLAKHALKSLYQAYQSTVSFMPKPVFGQNGSGMHIHFSLVDNETNKNIFYQEDGNYYLSPLAESFIAGVLAHARESAVLNNTSINSYKRLVPDCEAPVYICAGSKNRSALIRIPQITTGQENAARAEIRSPDPLCNPYLVLAALLKAGLDGIKKEMKLDQFVNENLFELDAQTIADKGIGILPSSLEEAIEVFAQSEFMHELLGDHLFHELIKYKRKEIQAYKLAVTDWEREQYL